MTGFGLLHAEDKFDLIGSILSLLYTLTTTYRLTEYKLTKTHVI